jgi:hypothetical protein
MILGFSSIEYKLFTRNSSGKIAEPPALSTSTKTPTKTVINSLASAQKYWENVGQLVVIRAIRLKEFNPNSAKFQAEAFGLKIEGFLRNGEAHTFYVVW